MYDQWSILNPWKPNIIWLGLSFALLTNNVVPPRIHIQVAGSILSVKCIQNAETAPMQTEQVKANYGVFLAQKWNNKARHACKLASRIFWLTKLRFFLKYLDCIWINSKINFFSKPTILPNMEIYNFGKYQKKLFWVLTWEIYKRN